MDQELDDRDVAEIEVHLGQCHTCADEVAAQVRFKDGLRVLLEEPCAPEGLRARVFADIEGSTVERDYPEPLVAPSRSRRWQAAWGALALAAVIALVAFIPQVTTVASASSDPLPVIEQAVDWHRGAYPIEVRGPDSSTVSQWFKGKVDFPVRPPRFQSDSVSFVGGRIASIQDRRAAYLVYEMAGTPITVMAFDGQGLKVPAEHVQKIGGRDVAIWNQGGYEVAVIQDAGVTYAFTSDLDERAFVSMLEGALSH